MKKTCDQNLEGQILLVLVFVTFIFNLPYAFGNGSYSEKTKVGEFHFELKSSEKDPAVDGDQVSEAWEEGAERTAVPPGGTSLVLPLIKW